MLALGKKCISTHIAFHNETEEPRLSLPDGPDRNVHSTNYLSRISRITVMSCGTNTKLECFQHTQAQSDQPEGLTQRFSPKILPAHDLRISLTIRRLDNVAAVLSSQNMRRSGFACSSPLKHAHSRKSKTTLRCLSNPHMPLKHHSDLQL